MRNTLAAGVIALSAALAACSKTGAKAVDASQAAASDTAAAAGTRAVSLPVVAAEARDGDLVLTINTTGLVRSDAEGTLKAEVGGTVINVPSHPGDHVRAGAPLVVLDPRPFDLAVREAQVGVDEATLRYEEFIVMDSLAMRRASSESYRRVANTRSGLAAAKVKLERAQLDRERAVIAAPFSGVVDRVTVAVGERVSAGQEVTSVVDMEHLRIEAAVLEHDLPLIRVGGEALISSAAAPNHTASGRVIAVLPLVDSAARAGRAYVRTTGNGVLRPGMYADVRLETSRLIHRRLVPAKAVIERDGRPLVFVVKDGRAMWTYINPGRSNGRETEVLPDSSTGQIPVNVDDQVIVEGHLTLTHDAPVRVVAPRETPRAKP
ncbi:MAG: efflux RND transporter periplasmic adaptor subunit [Gemmatimonadaceae bacterium]|nr:efflux RND transporter periplasmic adaptor subunit [Gemmatimonadaceae bacterium]